MCWRLAPWWTKKYPKNKKKISIQVATIKNLDRQKKNLSCPLKGASINSNPNPNPNRVFVYLQGVMHVIIATI